MASGYSYGPTTKLVDLENEEDDEYRRNQELLEGNAEYPAEKISWNFYAPNTVSDQSLLTRLRRKLCKNYAIGTRDVFPNQNRANVLTVLVDDPPVYDARQVLVTIQGFDGAASFA